MIMNILHIGLHNLTLKQLKLKTLHFNEMKPLKNYDDWHVKFFYDIR